MFTEHPNEEVRRAAIRLCDALCSWERSTGRQNLFVLIEQDHESSNGRFEFIADCGKPIPDDSRHGMTPDEFVKAHQNSYSNQPPY